MTVLVTGASGHLGRLVIEGLLARGVPAADIRAGARSLDAVADLADRGVQVVHLDYDDPATVAAAVAGVDRVLLISGSAMGQRIAQHQAVVDAAAAAGVQHLIYTSAPAADTSALILAPEHKATEELVTASGVPFTVLRNNWYTENYQQALETAATTGEIVAGVGDGRVRSASRIDFADAASVVLTETGHEGQIYELGGDIAWNFDDLAAAMSEVLGREVRYRRVDSAEHLEILKAVGLDEGTAGFVVALDGNIREGLLDLPGDDLARLIGRPTTTLVEGLRATLAPVG